MQIPRNHIEFITFRDFIDHILHLNPETPYERIVAATWGLWKKRCEITHEGKRGEQTMRMMSRQQIQQAMSMVEEFQKARGRMMHTSKVDTRPKEQIETEVLEYR